MSTQGNDAVSIPVSNLPFGDSKPCFIVAEIGQNHQGQMDIAKEMIHLAKVCGANCVKFQKSSLTDRFTQRSLDALYGNENSFGRTYGEHRAALEFSRDQFNELQHYAENVEGIMFTASAMDIPSADVLLEMNVPFIKIGSGDTNNLLLIEHVAKTKLPIVLSTGMQEFSTIKQVYELIRIYHKNFAILHCVSSYPTEPNDVNLAVMDLYKKEFPDITVGYSGHEKGIYIAIAAAARGAKIIERHFTKDKSLKGTDHQCSLDPIEFKNMVKGIRETEAALGQQIKRIMPCEIPCHEKLGKSIVCNRVLSKGSILQLADIAIKVCQPKGIPPQDVNKLIGLVVQETLAAESPLSSHHLNL